METFSALLALWVGNSPVTGEFPSQRPVTWSFYVFFDMSLSKRLSKQSRRQWFEAPSCSLWHHCNVPWKSWHRSTLHVTGTLWGEYWPFQELTLKWTKLLWSAGAVPFCLLLNWIQSIIRILFFTFLEIMKKCMHFAIYTYFHFRVQGSDLI